GVVVGDAAATEKLREQLRAERGDVLDFDMGPPLDEILARVEEETGHERPALIVVDMSIGFTDPASPLHCDLEPVVEAIERLLAAVRAARLPVVYTTVAYDEAAKEKARVFIDKVPALLTLEAGSRWTEIDPRLAPQRGEGVVTKLFASAFFGTQLANLLMAQQVDGVVVTG